MTLNNGFSDTAILYKEPEQITAGTYTRWIRSGLNSIFPTEEYIVYYIFRENNHQNIANELPDIDDENAEMIRRDLSGGGEAHKIEGARVQDNYLFVFNKQHSWLQPSSNYRWQLTIERRSDGETIVYDQGILKVSPNLADLSVDPRTHAEIMLSKIQSILEHRADSDVANYSIQGRSLVKLTISDLLKWRDYYKNEVRSEQVKTKKLGGTGTIKVRFT